MKTLGKIDIDDELKQAIVKMILFQEGYAPSVLIQYGLHVRISKKGNFIFASYKDIYSTTAAYSMNGERISSSLKTLFDRYFTETQIQQAQDKALKELEEFKKYLATHHIEGISNALNQVKQKKISKKELQILEQKAIEDYQKKLAAAFFPDDYEIKLRKTLEELESPYYDKYKITIDKKRKMLTVKLNKKDSIFDIVCDSKYAAIDAYRAYKKTARDIIKHTKQVINQDKYKKKETQIHKYFDKIREEWLKAFGTQDEKELRTFIREHGGNIEWKAASVFVSEYKYIQCNNLIVLTATDRFTYEFATIHYDGTIKYNKELEKIFQYIETLCKQRQNVEKAMLQMNDGILIPHLYYSMKKGKISFLFTIENTTEEHNVWNNYDEENLDIIEVNINNDIMKQVLPKWNQKVEELKTYYNEEMNRINNSLENDSILAKAIIETVLKNEDYITPNRIFKSLRGMKMNEPYRVSNIEWRGKFGDVTEKEVENVYRKLLYLNFIYERRIQNSTYKNYYNIVKIAHKNMNMFEYYMRNYADNEFLKSKQIFPNLFIHNNSAEQNEKEQTEKIENNEYTQEQLEQYTEQLTFLMNHKDLWCIKKEQISEWLKTLPDTHKKMLKLMTKMEDDATKKKYLNKLVKALK